MTTVPQMSPLRMPQRVAQPTQLAVPGHMMPPAPAGGFRMTGADVWRVIRANLWLIITLVVLMGGLGYLANRYLANNYPRYTASGLVRVEGSVNFNPLDNRTALVDL